MEEQDDWKLGDEGEPAPCPRCGKPTRAGLSYCAICGSPLADDLPTDPESLRTLGEAMGGRGVRRPVRRHSLRGWSIAAGLLLVAVVGLTWLQTRENPILLEDLIAPAPATPTPTVPPPVATARATQVVVPTARPEPSATETLPPPPEPTAVWTAIPTARRTPTRARRAVAPAVARPTSRPAAPVPVPDEVEPRVDRPRVEATEKPSLGSDLQDATRAYRQAVDTHNARVDEYNALADEVQRRNAWDDSEASVELRHRLDRARDAVETARVQAEMLRARMESIRARYR